MEIKEMQMEDIEKRMDEISTEIEAEGADIEALSKETDALIERKNELIAAASEKRATLDKVAKMKAEPVEKIEEKEGKSEMPTLAEIRESKEYINAFANYIKTGDDRECRALLSTNVTGGQVPVPTYVEGRIRTAWERLGLLNLVRKTYIRGNVKVGFELSATGAVKHTEGTDAPVEEVLTFGVVTMIPASFKKWITISDEVMDMGGEEFLDYIYDEITYRIARAVEDDLVTLVTGAPTAATATAVSVYKGSATGENAVLTGLAQLSDEAVNPVVVTSKATYANIKLAAREGQYEYDPFEGLDVYFNSRLTNTVIVGDFEIGAQANFPNGDEITLKYDDLSLAESDLVKIVGREYVALGLVADKAFAVITVTANE